MSNNKPLESKLVELWQQKENLSIKMRCEPDLRLKRKIELEKATIHKQISELQQKVDVEKDNEAIEQINKMLKDNILLIHVECNKYRIQPKETVEITFKPCSHKKKLKLAELLRAYTTFEARNVPESNNRLLQRWEREIKHGQTFFVTFNCNQCKKEKHKLKITWGRRNDKPVGKAIVIVRMLQ